MDRSFDGRTMFRACTKFLLYASLLVLSIVLSISSLHILIALFDNATRFTHHLSPITAARNPYSLRTTLAA